MQTFRLQNMDLIFVVVDRDLTFEDLCLHVFLEYKAL